MFLDPLSEIKNSINNVLNSPYSSKEISESCEISFTTISELRTGKREITKINFSFCKSLYNFAVSHKLNQEFLDTETKKGNHKYIPIDMAIKKIVVSFEPLDLFAYGYLNRKTQSNCMFTKSNTLSEFEISKSIFVDTKNSVYDTYQLGHFFNCCYSGGGPNNFVDFLSKYSSLPQSELKTVIFNNSVVEYNFETDELKGLPSKINGTPYAFYTLNNKIIFVLNAYDNHFNKDTPDLSNSLKDIRFILNALADNYGYNINVQQIKYIDDHNTDASSIYRLSEKNTYTQENDAHIILEFEQFEIWLPFQIYQERGDIFLNTNFQNLISGLNIQKPHNDKLFSNAVKMISKIEPISTLF